MMQDYCMRGQGRQGKEYLDRNEMTIKYCFEKDEALEY
jgi:hypothetical protein